MNVSQNIRILTFVDHYLPGWKAGGPTQSIFGLTSMMPSQFAFWVVTRDRDHLDRTPYPGIQPRRWRQVGKTQVLYVPPLSENIRNLARVAKDVGPDLIYLNSLFSRMTVRCLVARRLRMMPQVPVVLAPRGEFARDALRLKYYKKLPFLRLATSLGLLDGLTWQASSELEREDIVAQLSGARSISVSPNVVVAADVVNPQSVHEAPIALLRKAPGEARFLFLSRISRMKNLGFALKAMASLSGKVVFDIIGPVDDQQYWDQCRAIIQTLPQNVAVHYLGPLPHAEVRGAIQKYDFFVLPTLGENFGHVIYESLSAGCPVLLSDRTLWSAIEQANAGWVIPLAQERRWSSVMQQCVDMGGEQYARMAIDATGLAVSSAASQDAVRLNAEMFLRAVRAGPPPYGQS